MARKRLLAHLDEHRHEHNAVLRWVISRPRQRWIRLCGGRTRYTDRIGREGRPHHYWVKRVQIRPKSRVGKTK